MDGFEESGKPQFNGIEGLINFDDYEYCQWGKEGGIGAKVKLFSDRQAVPTQTCPMVVTPEGVYIAGEDIPRLLKLDRELRNRQEEQAAVEEKEEGEEIQKEEVSQGIEEVKDEEVEEIKKEEEAKEEEEGMEIDDWCVFTFGF